jgi:hypothetical protein
MRLLLSKFQSELIKGKEFWGENGENVDFTGI